MKQPTFIIDPPQPGAVNMAVDEALLARGEPVVRLYGWRPEAVSLGRAQTRDEVDLEAAAREGVDVVERVTGGGAILHNADEVTYAVVVPLHYPGMPATIPGSFAFLSHGVVLALQTLGVDAAIESSPDNTREALCYVRHQGTNIMVNGKKISGGAQRRTPTHVLQHGTVIVRRNAARMARLFRTEVETIRARVTSLRAEGRAPGRQEIIDALVEGFKAALSV